jgi:membrane associated rhomboid family serine protease
MKTAPPKMTLTLAGLTIASYLIVSATGQSVFASGVGGFIAARLSGLQVIGALPVWLTPLSATLLHASLIHIGFNLIMLVFCGREDEVALGPAGVIALYVVGAYAAAAAQYAVDPRTAVPMIGASGAISALVGAYAVLYGKRLPSRFSPEVTRWLNILWLAVAWVVVQLLVGLVSRVDGMGVAVAAHIGGFIAGILMARPLLRWRYRKA